MTMAMAKFFISRINLCIDSVAKWLNVIISLAHMRDYWNPLMVESTEYNPISIIVQSLHLITFYVNWSLFLCIRSSVECVHRNSIHLFMGAGSRKRLRFHFQLVSINLIDEVIAQWPLSLLKITQKKSEQKIPKKNRKKESRKKPQQQYQPIINVCLSFSVNP